MRLRENAELDAGARVLDAQGGRGRRERDVRPRVRRRRHYQRGRGRGRLGSLGRRLGFGRRPRLGRLGRLGVLPNSSVDSLVCADARRPGSNSATTASAAKPSFSCLLLRSRSLIAYLPSASCPSSAEDHPNEDSRQRERVCRARPLVTAHAHPGIRRHLAGGAGRSAPRGSTHAGRVDLPARPRGASLAGRSGVTGGAAGAVPAGAGHNPRAGRAGRPVGPGSAAAVAAGAGGPGRRVRRCRRCPSFRRARRFPW